MPDDLRGKAQHEDLRKIQEALGEGGVVLDDRTIRKLSRDLSRKGLEAARPMLVCQPDIYCVVVNDFTVDVPGPAPV